MRIVPVALAMLRIGARWPTVAFLGWFGPRGLASIVFAVIIVKRQLTEAQTILLTAYLTVGLSVIAHGLTAAPLADATPAGTSLTPDRSPAMESAPAHEHRPRGPARRAPAGRDSDLPGVR